MLIVIKLVYSREPEINGRRISEWAEDLDRRNADWYAYEPEAIRAIQSLGTNAVPYLIKLIDQEDSSVKQMLVRWEPSLKRKLSTKEHRNYLAARIINVIDPEVIKASVKDFTAFASSEDPAKASLAIEALQQIGPEALPALIAAANHREDSVRIGAINALQLNSMAISEADKLQVVTALLKGLRDSNAMVRRFAVIGLQHWGVRGDLVVPSVLALTEDKDEHCRVCAYGALTSFTNQAGAITPVLLRGLNDSNSMIREVAATTLRIVSPELANQGIGVLMKDLLCATNDLVRISAARALAEFGSRAAPAEPLVLQLLTDIPMAPRLPMRILQSIGPASLSNGIAILITNLSNADPAVRKAAAEELLNFERQAEAALPTLMNRLQIEKGELLCSVASAISAIAPKQRSGLVLYLVANLKDKDSDVRSTTATILAGFGTNAVAAIPELVAMLEDPELAVRYAVSAALINLDHETAKQAVPILMRQLQSKDRLVRLVAMGALGNFHSRAKEAIPLLLEQLKDENEENRTRARRVIRQIDPSVVLPR